MIHYGDITKISGYEVPIVDCVVGGSPCQDLSVAGKRAGLDGERSGLFMEQIRIIKEMRNKDASNGRSNESIRPRFMVWENVPGAFSSNKGEDFRIVLEETAKIVQEDAVIPMPPKGKWTISGVIVGDGFSIAWRVLDAQFWRVPQRRRRIALIADFGGQCAPEILFVRNSLRGDSQESGTEREGATSDAQGCIGVHDREGKTYGFPLGFRPENVRCYEETATTLCVGTRAGFCNGVIALEPGIASREGGHIYEDVSGTIRANAGDNQMSVAYSINHQGENAKFNIGVDENGVAFSHIAKGPGAVCCLETFHCIAEEGGTCFTLKARDYKDMHVICLQGNQVAMADTSNCNGGGFKEGTAYTLNTMDRHCVAYKKPHYIVRRLTPLECERLQGYADGWTDIGEYTDSKGKRKKSSDSARYKALGNSIALPPWKWVIKRLCSHYERDATLASLFDGIGGFPCIWEQINGKGTAIWASEIEDFPIAVTKARIE